MINILYIKKFVELYLIFFIFTVFYSCETKNISLKNKSSEKKPEHEVKTEDTLYSIIMVGDIMMGTNYPSSSSLPPNDGENLFDDVREYLQSADVTIGNLEGTLLDKGGTPKKCRDSTSKCISFRMPEHYAAYLQDAGFDIMSIANNHSGDMGDIGRISTVKTLERYNINYAGYETCPVTIYIKDGIRFGFSAFAPNIGTQDLLDINSAVKTVNELSKKCDIVIVSFHGGAEGSGAVHVPRRTEYYLGEKRGNVYEFAHAVIDAGADVVFGHGPHVPRGLELYDGKIIAYSLGNFCTFGKFGLSGALGYAPILKIYIDKSGEFTGGRIFPAVQIKRGIPVIDYEYKTVELIRNLSEKDFPESGLVIESDGKLSIK